MNPGQLITLAVGFNAIRARLSGDYVALAALDDICSLVATMADEADSEYGNIFRDNCIIGTD